MFFFNSHTFFVILATSTPPPRRSGLHDAAQFGVQKGAKTKKPPGREV